VSLSTIWNLANAVSVPAETSVFGISPTRLLTEFPTFNRNTADLLVDDPKMLALPASAKRTSFAEADACLVRTIKELSRTFDPPWTNAFTLSPPVTVTLASEDCEMTAASAAGGDIEDRKPQPQVDGTELEEQVCCVLQVWPLARTPAQQ